MDWNYLITNFLEHWVIKENFLLRKYAKCNGMCFNEMLWMNCLINLENNIKSYGTRSLILSIKICVENKSIIIIDYTLKGKT